MGGTPKVWTKITVHKSIFIFDEFNDLFLIEDVMLYMKNWTKAN